MLLRRHVQSTRQWNLRLVLPATHYAHRSCSQSTSPPRPSVTLPRRCFSTHRVLCSQVSEHDVQAPGIAVLGAGITGLTTAYLLADTFPKLRITLVESKDTLGGWVRSKKVDVGDGEVIFEQGPRSLRPQPPNGTLALRIIQDLELTPDLLITPKSSAAARNRFIYYPDHLVRMPGPKQADEGLISALWKNISTVWSEPVFKNVFSSILNEPTVETRPTTVEDESVGAFVARRWDPALANNLVSALFHGIYAGDIWKLSAKSIMAGPWRMEIKYENLFSSMYAGAVQRQSWGFCDDIALHMNLQEVEWDDKIKTGMRDCSVFTFKHGLGQLTEKMVERLEARENVQILRSTTVKDVERDGDGNLKITHTTPNSPSTSPTSTTYTHAISTIPPKALLPLLRPTNELHINTLNKTLGATSAVTVMVVNLYFRTPHLLQTLNPPGGFPRVDTLAGFGYLIPNSVPFAQNPERALGVIFDSDISPDLWNSVPDAGGEVGTKLTVMMGGHWWDGWAEFPSSEEGEEMARAVLKRHLGITETPVLCHATLQRDCIPQYHVGHSKRMAEGHEALSAAFGDRLRVAGAWYTGVGVNDCLRAAFDVVAGLAADVHAPSRGGEAEEAFEGFEGMGRAVRASCQGREKRYYRGERTGLEGFKRNRPMVLSKRNKGGAIELMEVEREGREMGFFMELKVSGQKEKSEDD